MIIKVNIKHSLLKTTFIEIRLDTDMKILEVKDKIYQMTGTAPQHQDLTLIRGPNDTIVLSPEHALLKDFNAQTGMDMNVVDRNPYSMLTAIQQQDVEKVYYKMTDQEYDKLTNSVRAYKRAKFENDPEYRKKMLEAQAKREEARQKELEAVSKLHLDDRCKVLSKNQVGTIKFIGGIDGRVGIYIGVELDLPMGDTDGTIEGVSYFTTQKACGVFAKPIDVEAGDFPQEDLGLSDSDEL